MEEKAAELIRKNNYIKKLEVNLKIKSKYETNPMIPTKNTNGQIKKSITITTCADTSK